MTDNNNLAKGDLSPFPFSPGKVMKRRMKDIHVRKKAIKIYMIKIYSNMLNTYMIIYLIMNLDIGTYSLALIINMLLHYP